MEVKAATAYVERTLDSAGSTKLRHIIFVIIESGMTLFAIQVVRLVLWIEEPLTLGSVNIAANYFVAVGEICNVVIRSVHFYFVLLKIVHV